MAKAGLDGHDRGVKVIAAGCATRASRSSTRGSSRRPTRWPKPCSRRTPTPWGSRCSRAAHLTLFERVIAALRERGLDDVVVFGGGIVPDADRPALAHLGVAEVFTPGASLGSITDWLTRTLDARDRLHHPT